MAMELDRREFMILSASATALAYLGTTVGCRDLRDPRTQTVPGSGFYPLAPECHCSACRAYQAMAPWHLPNPHIPEYMPEFVAEYIPPETLAQQGMPGNLPEYLRVELQEAIDLAAQERKDLSDSGFWLHTREQLQCKDGHKRGELTWH